MIVYKNVIRLLKDAGYNTTRILEERILSQSTMAALRHNKPLNTKSIDKICHLLHCQPGDIMEHIEDQPADE